MHSRTLLTLALAVAAAVGCSDDGSRPDSPGARGSWHQLTGGVGESDFRAVWGTSIDTLLATGAAVPLAAALNGGWRPVSLPVDSTSLDAIWANSPDDVYVAGESGAAFHFDGDSWASIPAAEETRFVDLCATPAGEVFACVEGLTGPAVLKRANNTWEPFAGSFPELQAIWANGAQAIYVAGEDGYVGRFDGVQWLPISRATGFTWVDIWGTSPDQVFFVGAEGRVARYFFTVWVDLASPVSVTLRSISGNSATNIFAVGDAGTILHFDGVAWTQQPVVTPRDLLAVHMFPDGRAVALGALGTVLGFDGSAWRIVQEGQPEVFVDAIGFDAQQVFFAGHSGADGVVRHLDGRAWTLPGERPRGIWGLAPNDVVVVGDFGAGYHFDGSNWTKMANGSIARLAAVAGAAGAAGARAYAGGPNANLRYSSAPFTAWSPMVPPLTAIYDVRDVWAAAPDNVYAIGPSATILRYHGAASLKWSAEETGLAVTGFSAITGRSASDVTTVTDDGRVYHFDGTHWLELPVPVHAPWVDVVTGARGTFVSVSSLPNTVMITGFDLGDVPDPVYLGPFHAGWITPGAAYVAGDEGSIFRYAW